MRIVVHVIKLKIITWNNMKRMFRSAVPFTFTVQKRVRRTRERGVRSIIHPVLLQVLTMLPGPRVLLRALERIQRRECKVPFALSPLRGRIMNGGPERVGYRVPTSSWSFMSSALSTAPHRFLETSMRIMGQPPQAALEMIGSIISYPGRNDVE